MGAFVRNILTVCALFAASAVSVARAADSACVPTGADMLGPFYVSEMPVLDDINRFGKPGEPVRVSGAILSAAEGNPPVVNARVEVWQTDGDGNYHPHGNGARADYDDSDLDMRGATTTDENGRYNYRSLVPGEYGSFLFGRPSHFHYRISAPGFRSLTTQHYVLGGDRRIPDAECRAAEITRDGDVALFVAPDIYLRPEAR
ncbi:MAG: hypothetical protein ACR2QC_12850 [Gammaproteobacteria bacterium]